MIVISYLMSFSSTVGGLPSALALLIICLSAFAALSAEANGGRASPVGYAEWARQVLETPPASITPLDELSARLAEMATKRRRDAAGRLRPLADDGGLSRAARAHAIDLLDREYMDHASPDGRTASERVGILDRRFVGGVGENLAEHVGLGEEELSDQIGPLALKIMDGWMASSGHRHNLLSPEYTHQGIGAAVRGDRLVVVHVFGSRQATLEEPLPIAIKAGRELPLGVAEDAEGATPEKYALAPAGEPASEAVALDLTSNEVVVDPGIYRLEFFIPTKQSQTFAVADGPILVVE